MSVVKKEAENVEEMIITLPEQNSGANTLVTMTGTILINLEANAPDPSDSAIISENETYIVVVGPVLESDQIRSVRATASITGVYFTVSRSSEPGSGQVRWNLGDVDAVHDDDSKRARIMINVAVLARAGAFVRIEKVQYEARILAKFPS